MSKFYALFTVTFLIAAAPALRAGEPIAVEAPAGPMIVGTEAGPPCPMAERPGCLRRVAEWATYQPLDKGVARKCCCQHCTSCCHPPLYTYFLCNGGCGCCGPNGCGASNAPPPNRCTCLGWMFTWR